MLRYHVPAVHALPGPKVVYHERGSEALYPSAARRVAVPLPKDEDRRGMRPKGDAAFQREVERVARKRWPLASIVVTRRGMPEARFVPDPYETQKYLLADVVFCPRARTYGSAKNWAHWRPLVKCVKAMGMHAFAAGAPDSSVEIGCPSSWDRKRHLDASIQAMRGARLVVATDAGLAHLAVLCGAPLLLITYRGLVAPGPVLDPQGKVMEPAYWPVRMEEYYHAANHMDSPIWTSHAWEDPGEVEREMVALLEGDT
jgi:hypothetical protein